MSNFSINKALSSESYAKQCYYNYYYEGNTMNIDANSISKINKTYSGTIGNWKAQYSQDQNEYNIIDDNETSYKGKTRKASKKSIGNAAMAVGGAVGAEVAKKIVIRKGAKLAADLSFKASQAAYGTAVKNAGETLI